MQVFYQGWNVAQQFLHADARLPSEVALPRPPERQAARWLEERREHPVLAVIDALGPLAQPELLTSAQREAATVGSEEIVAETGVLEVPMPHISR